MKNHNLKMLSYIFVVNYKEPNRLDVSYLSAVKRWKYGLDQWLVL